MLRWPVQLRILLSNVRKFDRIAFYLRTVFLDKVLSAFRVYQQAGNAFFAIGRSSLFHQKLRIIFLNAPIISNGNVAHTLSLCVRALVAAVSIYLTTQKIMIIRFCIHAIRDKVRFSSISFLKIVLHSFAQNNDLIRIFRSIFFALVDKLRTKS